MRNDSYYAALPQAAVNLPATRVKLIVYLKSYRSADTDKLQISYRSEYRSAAHAGSLLISQTQDALLI